MSNSYGAVKVGGDRWVLIELGIGREVAAGQLQSIIAAKRLLSGETIDGSLSRCLRCGASLENGKERLYRGGSQAGTWLVDHTWERCLKERP